MNVKQLKFEYDSEVDAAYLTLAKGKVVDSEEVEPGLIVDLDKNERILGVEILEFSRRFQLGKKGKKKTKTRKDKLQSALR